GSSSRSGSGMPRDGTRKTTSPGTRNGSGLRGRPGGWGGPGRGGAPGGGGGHEGGGRPDQVLAVVENQQELERLELGEEGSEDRRRFAPQGPQIERLGNGAGDLRTVGNGVQLDEQHAVLVGRSAVSSELERKPSLAHA